MKQIETIKSGKNFSAVSVGKMSEIIEHVRFLHTHKTHEELYIILKGEGQYQVDGEIFPVSEGTIIRVAPDGKRALKNTGSENLTMLCIQYKANAFTEADSPMTDGTILQEELKW